MWVWLRIYLTGFNDTILKQKDTDKSYSRINFRSRSIKLFVTERFFFFLSWETSSRRTAAAAKKLLTKWIHVLFEITHFHGIVVQGRHSNVLKSVTHVQSCRCRQILRSLFSQFCFFCSCKQYENLGGLSCYVIALANSKQGQSYTFQPSTTFFVPCARFYICFQTFLHVNKLHANRKD